MMIISPAEYILVVLYQDGKIQLGFSESNAMHTSGMVSKIAAATLSG